MLSKTTKTLTLASTLFTLLALPACDADSDAPPVHQTVEEGVDQGAFDRLTSAGELDLENDDFRIYGKVAQDGFGEQDQIVPKCIFDANGDVLEHDEDQDAPQDIFEDECGFCTCGANGVLYCIDLICEPDDFDLPAESEPHPFPQGPDELDTDEPELIEPPKLLCEDGVHTAGDSWHDKGQACECDDEGAVTCTLPL